VDLPECRRCITVEAQYGCQRSNAFRALRGVSGKSVASSGTAPMLQVWWLRPVSRAMRVGALIAAV